MSDILDQRTVNPDSVSPRPTAMRYGLLGGLAMIVLNLVFYLSEMLDLSKASFISLPNLTNYALMIAVVVLALRYHRDQELGGYLPFTRCLGMGWWLGLTMGIVGAIWAYIFFQFVAPDLVETIREMQIEQMQDQGLSEEQIEQSEKYMAMFTSPGAMAILSIFGNVLMTIIIALFAGLFMKKDPPPNV